MNNFAVCENDGTDETDDQPSSCRDEEQASRLVTSRMNRGQDTTVDPDPVIPDSPLYRMHSTFKISGLENTLTIPDGSPYAALSEPIIYFRKVNPCLHTNPSCYIRCQL